MMDQRPRHEQANVADTAASKMNTILKAVSEEQWESGAQVTSTIISDRFCLTTEEGCKGLVLLAEQGILEEINGSFFVK